jgi:threonine/homoserine/homoserine lactone efflux protein
MFLKGFQFGMLLQFSIGPVSLFVFRVAGEKGFLAGFLAVLAVALTDGLYILLAGAGVASVMKNPAVQRALKVFGCAVLVLFGLDAIGGAFGRSLLVLPGIFSSAKARDPFLQGDFLTASNPLTILFWGGVFSAAAKEKGLKNKELVFFGLGCVASALVFLSLTAVLGSVLQSFLPEIVINFSNPRRLFVMVLGETDFSFKKIKNNKKNGPAARFFIFNVSRP